MATPEQKAEVDAAWAVYRAETMGFKRDLTWTAYLDADERAFKRYLANERLILSAKAKAA